MPGTSACTSRYAALVNLRHLAGDQQALLPLPCGSGFVAQACGSLSVRRPSHSAAWEGLLPSLDLAQAFRYSELVATEEAGSCWCFHTLGVHAEQRGQGLSRSKCSVSEACLYGRAGV